MASHRITKALKAHVITDRKTPPRRVAVINAETMAELTKSLNAYLEMHPATGTIYNAGFDPRENRYYALVDDVFDKLAVDEPFECPLNTDQLTLGQHDVYFKVYPNIKWCVDHIDGDYVYLGLYNASEQTIFGSNSTYSSSRIAARCTTFLNNVIPNVSQHLENVTVNGATNKVFIPSKKMFSGASGGYDGVDANDPTFDWPSSVRYNRRACISDWNAIDEYFWLSSPYNFSYVWNLRYDGVIVPGSPGDTFGFRPEVKVRFKKTT